VKLPGYRLSHEDDFFLEQSFALIRKDAARSFPEARGKGQGGFSIGRGDNERADTATHFGN
jgi:hypothetical protein